MNKINLRKKAKEIRKNLPICLKSELLAGMIKESELFKTSDNIMLYYPTEYEINLLSLLGENKKFYFPRVNSEKLEVCPYDLKDNFQKSPLNILEPCTNPVSAQILDLITVPALMCDKRGYRLGYGGGFYDRFLKNAKAKTICAIPQELYIDKLPTDNFDIPVDKVFIA